MKLALFVPSKLTYWKNLRCLNLPLLVSAVTQNRSLSSAYFVFKGQSIYSGKVKYLGYSENVNFEGTNSVDSILGVSVGWFKKEIWYTKHKGLLHTLTWEIKEVEANLSIYFIMAKE